MNPDMEPAAERAHRKIRDDIVSGELEGGIHLRETELAEKYGYSRTPIREALRRLQAEGLVEAFPHRGSRVIDWQKIDIEAMYDIRALIEGFIVRRATPLITTDQLERMKEVCGKIEAITKSAGEKLDAVDNKVQRIVDLNSELHGEVAVVAGGYQLAAVRNAAVVQPLMLRMIWGFSASEQERSNRHHRELIEAFEARDPLWAEAIMRSHLHAGKNVLLQRQLVDSDSDAADHRY